MRKKADTYLYTAECYFFSASIAMLARQQKSIYEIALLLEAHINLIEQYVVTVEIKTLLLQNNEVFINRINSEYADPVQRDRVYWSYFILHSSNGKYYFVSNFPKTFDYWLKKNKNGDLVFPKVLAADETYGLTGNTATEYFSSNKKIGTGILPLRKIFEIINAFLNGYSIYRIKATYHCTTKEFQQLQVENNLPAKVNEECIIHRILETLKARANHEFIKDQFPSVSASKIKKVMMDYKNGKPLLLRPCL